MSIIDLKKYRILPILQTFMNYIVLCISYLICWRICFSPLYHLAGFTYTLYSAMFLSIGIIYTIIIVSLVVLVDQLCIQVPDYCRVYYLEVYLGLEVYLLLSTGRSIQDWRCIYYCLHGGLSRTGGLSIIVYLEVCLGLEFYLLLSTCRSIQYWCSIYYCLPGCLSWTGGISVIVYLEVYLGLVFYLGMTFQTVSSSWLGFLQFYSQLNYSVSLLIILLHVNRRTFNDFELRRLTTYCRF